MVGDLITIVLLVFVCSLFWQQRRQAELAKTIAISKCNQLDLQFISVALKCHKLKTPDGLWRWHSIYQFEFSALGDDCYEGKVVMQGFQLMRIDLPPHRI
ncbi:DUF3301 domain-containing protein [Vibrio ostreicida]|uniref:DUF3301 domain-containing protein n=1 Tax=Vibrio ostreicida TaxID=526588 RepID=A0ABT8BVM6_9VIBR|nr:DUF3301 domain-containing protein [Vibrio ostreicida]MDN3610708.1 DUF3301 domain-containing protein [Vibrio ostreicida]NPD07294.1 DUF3301 domain-containing protein [Vibrio ostreicida]